MQVQLVVGDWGGDGHERTETFLFDAQSQAAVVQAYQKGVELVGVDITKFCDEYLDSDIPAAEVQKLIAAGMTEGMIDGNDDGTYYMHHDSFAQVYRFIAMKGDPELRMDPVQAETIHIGGYGLFG